METQNNNFLKILKKIKSSDFIYLCIIFLFFIIVFILFIYSTNFFINNINKIFSPGNVESSQTLNIKNYKIIESKLNLPINIPSTTATPTLNENTPATNNTSTTITPKTTELNKKLISINILNSTTIKGIASVLAKTLETAGFASATTGNEKKVYATTTILIKDSKKEYSSSILDVIKKSYPKTLTDINPETSTFDVVIIIGKE